MTWSAIAWIPTCLILACLLVAIATDLRDRIIPNRLVLIVLGCSAGLRLLSGPGPLLTSLFCAITILTVLGGLAAYDFMGWGDVKLIAAVSFAVPADRVITLLFAITLAGGLLSCIYLAIRFALLRMTPSRAEPQSGRPWALGHLAHREGVRILANEPMPYALAVLGGVAFGLATA